MGESGIKDMARSEPRCNCATPEGVAGGRALGASDDANHWF